MMSLEVLPQPVVIRLDLHAADPAILLVSAVLQEGEVAFDVPEIGT